LGDAAERKQGKKSERRKGPVIKEKERKIDLP